jgi:predicted transcriptional regulator
MRAQALVARNLRRLRVERGLSQENLAADAGIDRTYMSRLERGLENPTVAILEQLAVPSVPTSSSSSSCRLPTSRYRSHFRVVVALSDSLLQSGEGEYPGAVNLVPLTPSSISMS